MADYNFVQYKCTYCGTTVTRAANTGRPNPRECVRKGKKRDGKYKPHSWVINKKMKINGV